MVRAAKVSDAEAICALVNYHAERGRMLHRSLESVYDSLRDFLVCHEDGQLVGCVALSVSWQDLGEIRSLAVAAGHEGQGIGRRLIAQAIEDAGNLGLKHLFALTYEPDFFAKLAFRVVDKETLPTKVWRDCIHCPKADACDEIAMVLDLA
jgi:amino-acid N-acetyltransferase